MNSGESVEVEACAPPNNENTQTRQQQQRLSEKIIFTVIIFSNCVGHLERTKMFIFTVYHFFSCRTNRVIRVDAVVAACTQLPSGRGSTDPFVLWLGGCGADRFFHAWYANLSRARHCWGVRPSETTSTSQYRHQVSRLWLRLSTRAGGLRRRQTLRTPAAACPRC